MSREDPQESLPSFASDEDDAYNVPTKVGAMPADVAARLRAEGLLPHEASSPQSPSSRTSTSLPSFASEPSPDEVTNVYAELSSQEMVTSIPSPRPPPLPGPMRTPSTPVQTSVAVAAPKTSAPLQTSLEDEAEAAEIRAFGGRSQMRMLVLLIAGMVALVVLAFVMALLSQRR